MILEKLERMLHNIDEVNKEIVNKCGFDYLDNPIQYSMTGTSLALNDTRKFLNIEVFLKYLEAIEGPNLYQSIFDKPFKNVNFVSDIKEDMFDELIINKGYIYSNFNHGPLQNLHKIFGSELIDRRQESRFIKSHNLDITMCALGDKTINLLMGLNLWAGERRSIDTNFNPIIDNLDPCAQSSIKGLNILRKFPTKNTVFIDAFMVKKMASNNYFDKKWLQNLPGTVFIIGPSHLQGYVSSCRDKKVFKY